jgi:hypothetical protein
VFVEQLAAHLEHVAPNPVVEVAQVSGELVEDQRQPEREVLVLEAGVSAGDGSVAQPAGCLLDDLLVRPQLPVQLTLVFV